MLDGRSVTTHWRALETLQKENPKALVEKDTLYTMSSDLWTSAGVLSGVDMMLDLVSKDLSPSIALNIARNIVVYLFREGGQSQFSGPINMQAKAAEGDLVNLISWLETKLSTQITVEDMASFMNTSLRSLHRKCQTTLKMSPAHIFSELRLEHARTLLSKPNIAIKVIATECGFSDSAAFSKAFSKRFGLAPKRYSEKFQDLAS